MPKRTEEKKEKEKFSRANRSWGRFWPVWGPDGSVARPVSGPVLAGLSAGREAGLARSGLRSGLGRAEGRPRWNLKIRENCPEKQLENSSNPWEIGKSEAKQRKQRWMGS